MTDTSHNISVSGYLARITAGLAFAAGAWASAKAVASAFNRFYLKGRVVLVTGGSRGLGLILARQLAEEGAKVVICARSEETLQHASEDLSSRTSDYLAIPCDITDKQQVKELVQQIHDEMGSVDILINNAGTIQVGPMELMSEEDYVSALNIHFWGPFYVMRAVLPDMMARKMGRIVNIVSIGGKISVPHLLPYNTSKYALSGLSEGMAAELKKYNIKVTSVYPGLMRTGSPRNVDVKGQHKKEYALFKLSDSLPVLSMNADSAAGRIIRAMKQGDRTITLTLPAKLALAVHGFAPALTIYFFERVSSLLPRKTGDRETRKGRDSESGLSEFFLTKKTDEAAEKNLENQP